MVNWAVAERQAILNASAAMAAPLSSTRGVENMQPFWAKLMRVCSTADSPQDDADCRLSHSEDDATHQECYCQMSERGPNHLGCIFVLSALEGHCH